MGLLSHTNSVLTLKIHGEIVKPREEWRRGKNKEKNKGKERVTGRERKEGDVLPP